MDGILLPTVSILVLLGLSALFSGSETALTAASAARMHHLETGGSIRARLVNRLRRNKDRLIGALLLGNNLVNILASALATSVLLKLVGEVGVVYATIGMTLLVLIFSEVLPKTYALNHADRVALAVAPIVRLVVIASRPVAGLVSFIVDAILRLFGQHSPAHASSMEELRGAIELQDIPHDIRSMLRSVLDLGEVEVGDIMIPRGRMVAIDADLESAALVEQVLASPHTRIPLWRDDPDNIVGILHTRLVVGEMRRCGGSPERLNIEKLMQRPLFIPPSTRLIDQLRAFRSQQAHLAIIINEYGAVDGLVTLEDILEEIVGDIYDEHERPLTAIRQELDGSYRVRGWVTLRDLNRQFNWRLPDDDASTVAGLITAITERIPDLDQEVQVAGFRIRVTGRTSNRVAEARIWPPPPQPDDQD
jgi:Mg2+/Co2+ transporter CorB